MSLQVKTGKKTSDQRYYETSGIIVDTGEKVVHSGNIVLGRGIRETASPPRTSVQPSPKKKSKKKPPSSDVTIIRKGQKLGLDQVQPNFSKGKVCMGWEAPSSDYDLDISVFMVDTNNKTDEGNFIFYNNPKSPCTGVILGGNAPEEDDVEVLLDLNKIPQNIQKLAFTLTINEAEEKRQNFSRIKDVYFRILDSTSKEKMRYTIDDSFSVETAIVVAEIYRYKGTWKLTSIGSGFRGGLQALCENYGIEVM